MYPAVLLSTIFTLFTTLWCCIRPDFPSPHDSRLRVLSTKLNIITWVLICPEVVLYWQLRQWFEAGNVAKGFQVRGWTRRHGLFFLMGGFILCDKEGKPIKTLSFGHFTRLLHQQVIDFPILSSKEIQERSNFHPIVGLLALLQAIWFIMHCLSHFINTTGSHLPAITQLEAIIATIEISCLCIFIFAWKKPLDAGFCQAILLKHKTNRRRFHVQDMPRTIRQVFKSQQNLVESQIKQRKFQLENPPIQSTFISKLIKKLKPRTRFLVAIVLWLPKSIYDDINELIPPDAYFTPDFPDGTLKVPFFFVQNTMFQRIFLLPPGILSLGISLVSFLFVVPTGNTTPYHFPSANVQLAWRIASITALSFSSSALAFTILSIFFYFLADLFGNYTWTWLDAVEGLSHLCLKIVIWILLIGVVPFLIARVVLLVTSVVFWSFAPGEGGTWADYVPHFPLMM